MHPDIADLLNPYAEIKYKKFAQKLLPPETNMLGVRLPVLRRLAKNVVKEKVNIDIFLAKLTTETFEEKMLYGLIVALVPEPLDIKRKRIKIFLPQIDNWSICDSFCATLKWTPVDKRKLISDISCWLKSDNEYYVRVGVVMLLDHYIEPEWIEQCLNLLEQVQHKGYYAQMAVAWAMSVCFIKFPKKTSQFLEQNKLSNWTQNKAIQKICDSYRVSDDEKKFVKRYKRED